MPFQISSVLVAAEAIWKRAVSPASDTNFFITNSAMGERQMLPWQMKSTFIIVLFLLVLPRNALFCKGFWLFCCDLVFALKLQIMANQSRIKQIVTTCW